LKNKNVFSFFLKVPVFIMARRSTGRLFHAFRTAMLKPERTFSELEPRTWDEHFVVGVPTVHVFSKHSSSPWQI